MKFYRITSGGRITIPAKIRLKYNLKNASKVEFIERNGIIKIKLPKNKKTL